jgi:hypothetical protein
MGTFGRYGGRRKRKREKAWVVKDGEAALNATAFLMSIAQETGTSEEEVADSLARLEASGGLRREANGAVVILPPDTWRSSLAQDEELVRMARETFEVVRAREEEQR